MKATTLRRRLTGLALIAALIPGAARATIDISLQMALGNPSNATTSLLDEADYLIRRPQYAMAYSRYDGIPRWTSWHLSAEDIGGAERGNPAVDTTLPVGWIPTPVNAGWSAAGYDRGHMCPSGDRTASVADNKQVFLMTNMIPQTSDNNQGPWERLESYCRDLARDGNELYIVCGGRGYRESITTTSSGQTVNVTAPSYTWKVILVLPVGDNDIVRINENTRVIAVDMPNISGIRGNNWKDYRTTTDFIEAQTGLDFFSNVPVAIQNAIESRVDNG